MRRELFRLAASIGEMENKGLIIRVISTPALKKGISFSTRVSLALFYFAFILITLPRFDQRFGYYITDE